MTPAQDVASYTWPPLTPLPRPCTERLGGFATGLRCEGSADVEHSHVFRSASVGAERAEAMS